ncbi:heterogeneous nuclear ribonucleoprotein Q isoform X1 [Cynara cardunculus var. scolymus]|uniref:heterogeneous nuclear ribonucleoprotein Q isoform X1 n=1 Tax=Cynara cardunculus var. scolymus TaxID=59895 RepID=UPI000D62D2CB|nr:heterogeneous nuclear ribonucleoprotein Q isoform X1 [Cynara cardunculus var. scolymus]
MPPKSARKSVGPGRRGGRARGTPKVSAQPDPEAVVVPEESVKPVEEAPVEAKEEEDPALGKEEEVPVGVKKADAVKVQEANEEKVEKVEEKPVADNGIDRSKREDNDVKDSVEEYEKGERLDLEDNDPEESEPEEYVGEDYDEKEVVEDVQEEVLDVEEEVEDGDVGEDEEGDDIPEGEMEDPPEELEPEEEEHAAEEHAGMADAEEQEQHDVFKERRKRKEFEIFVGGLDKDATEEDLRKVFSEVGEVSEVRLMMNAQSKKNKGFAFLRFATVEQAKRACVELKNPVVHGKQCGVSPSQDSDTLFLGNICKTWTQEALKEKLKNYGIDTVEDLTLVEDSKTDGTNRGFAFLEFSSRSDAMDAFKRLQKRDVTFGVDRPAKVSFADSFIDPGDEIMAQVKTVFVDGLPSSWDEVRVRDLLKKYGEVEKIELARNMPSARRKDYGFITFGTHDAAVTCAKSINNVELGEGENKAKVRARLSRPLQRGKGKHISRGDFRPGRAASGGFRGPWARPVPRNLPPRGIRRLGGRLPPVVDRSVRRPVGLRDRRPVVALPPRGRPVAPLPRSYDRRPPVPSHTKNSLKRDYGRREELPPRSRAIAGRAIAEYGPPRSTSERNSSYRDSYPTRGPTYADLPRGSSHSTSRRAYTDGGYSTRFERPPPSYREGRPRDYDPVPGSKRPYAALDDVPPRYADAEVRQSRVRLDYEIGGGSSQYGDAYSDRLGRSNIGYGSSRSSMSAQDSHGLYSSRQGLAYGGGSYSGSDGGGIYSSSYGGDYISRGSDVGGSSYSSSLYSGRSLGGSGYMGSGGSGSYY